MSQHYAVVPIPVPRSSPSRPAREKRCSSRVLPGTPGSPGLVGHGWFFHPTNSARAECSTTGVRSTRTRRCPVPDRRWLGVVLPLTRYAGHTGGPKMIPLLGACGVALPSWSGHGFRSRLRIIFTKVGVHQITKYAPLKPPNSAALYAIQLT